MQESNKAVADLNTALQLAPTNADYWYALGNVHAGLGEAEAAKSAYVKATEYNPDHSAAWYNHGNMLFSELRFKEAVESWNKTIAIQPGLFRAYNNRAAAYVQLKQFSRAQEDYEKTIELNPAFARAYDNYAWLLATADDRSVRNPAKAVANAKKACELTDFKDWSHLSTLAASYAEAADFENARRWLIQSHELAPANQKDQLGQLIGLYETELSKSRLAKQPASADRVRL